MPHRKDTQIPPDRLPQSRTARLIWLAGLGLGIAAGAFVAFQLAGFGGPVGQ